VREDGRAILHAEEVRGAALRAGVPSTLIRARRGLMDDPEHPFVPVGEARAFQGRPDARLVELEGAGHDAITLGALGAGAVAGAIRDAPL